MTILRFQDDSWALLYLKQIDLGTLNEVEKRNSQRDMWIAVDDK